MKKKEAIEEVKRLIQDGQCVCIRLGKGWNGANAQVRLLDSRSWEEQLTLTGEELNARFDLHNQSSTPAYLEKTYYVAPTKYEWFRDGCQYMAETRQRAEDFCTMPLGEWLQSLPKIVIQDENYW